jgi:hypothetical protein
MYVMSSLPPSKQSVAGGIFGTSTRLCTNLALGISTAIFHAVQSQPGNGDAIKPYLSVFWFGAAVTGTSTLLVPFLKIGTQGGAQTRYSSDTTGSTVTAAAPAAQEVREEKPQEATENRVACKKTILQKTQSNVANE